jgi:DUF1009 family protein
MLCRISENHETWGDAPVTPLGLLAGKGRFPFLVAEEAKRHGRRVVAVAIREAADLALEEIISPMEWVHPGQLSKAIKFFKSHGAREIVMAGLVHHTNIFRLRPDLRTMRLFMKLPDRKADTILRMVADEFAREGLTLLPSVSYLTHCLAEEGPMTRRKPTRKEQEDLLFGFQIAKAIAGLDIGQTVCVKDKAILAVEGMEGTDACIRRAGTIAQGPFVVVKVAKPRQDVRFDVPVVGIQTIETLAESGASLIAVEAKKTLLLDRRVILELANTYGIGVTGLNGAQILS